MPSPGFLLYGINESGGFIQLIGKWYGQTKWSYIASIADVAVILNPG